MNYAITCLKPTDGNPATGRFTLATCLLNLLILLGAVGNARAQGTLTLSNIWNISVNSVYDMGTGNNERGVAINPVTGNVIYASRTSSNHLSVVNGETGAFIKTMSNTDDFGGLVISGGTLTLTHCGVADDGVVYACNLTASTSALKIYRWDGENANPVVVFGPANPGTLVARYGDSFDVRGAGTNTQIIISGNGAGAVAFFSTADGTNFTATGLSLGTGMTAGDFGKGLSFGTNNTIWGKNSSSTAIRHASFDAVAGTTTLIETVTADSLGVAVANDVTNRLLAVVVSDNNTTQTSHRLKVYNIATPSAPTLISDVLFPTPNAANANRIGAVDIQLDKIVGLDPNNGIVALKKVFVANLPPSFTSEPVSQSVLQGGYVTFSAPAIGTEPLRYQWRKGTDALAGQTNSSLTLTNLQLSDAGDYSVVVTNVAGTATSSNATLTILPAVLSQVMTPIWSLAPGSRAYLSSDNTQRGLTYNPVTDHVLVASRAGTAAIRILASTNGTDLGSLDMTGVGGQAGETFPINLVGAADDGAIYVCNLGNTGNGGGFTIYRWADENPTTVPTIVYGPDTPTGARIGDTMDVRGVGTNTQIICATRAGTQVVIFSGDPAAPPLTATMVDFAAAGVPGGFAGLGVAFGSGDTFWAKSAGQELRHCSFDLSGTVAPAVLETFFPSSTPPYSNISAIGVDSTNDYLGGISFSENPQNLQLYSTANRTADPVQVDQEYFPTSFPNQNGTGAVDFDVSGRRVFALDSNNGILALRYTLLPPPTLSGEKIGSDFVLTWSGAAFLQSATNVVGPYTDISGATSPYTNAISNMQFFRLRR